MRRQRQRGPRRRERGFSLLEVIISLAITAAALTAFYAAGGSATALVTRAQQRAQATAVARDLLSSVGVDLPLREGTETGTAADGTTWRLDIDPVSSLTVDGASSDASGLYRVRVTVEAQGRAPPQVFSTLRLDRAYLR